MPKKIIYAEDAIDAVHAEFDECLVWDESGQYTADEVERILTEVPSAQPERCEDCVNFSKTRLLIPQPEKRTEERTETHARDLIDRQAAIEAIRIFYADECALVDSIEEQLEKLPSAQCDNCHYKHIWMTQRMNGNGYFGHGGATG